MNGLKGQRKKGMRSILLEMTQNEKKEFPRPSYGNIRTTLSTMKIEFPERQYGYRITDTGIEVSCLK